MANNRSDDQGSQASSRDPGMLVAHDPTPCLCGSCISAGSGVVQPLPNQPLRILAAAEPAASSSDLTCRGRESLHRERVPARGGQQGYPAAPGPRDLWAWDPRQTLPYSVTSHPKTLSGTLSLLHNTGGRGGPFAWEELPQQDVC